MFTKSFKYAVVMMFALGCFSPVLAQDIAIPTVNAGLGPCSVDFTVTNSIYKPVYGALIQTSFKYGYWGLRRMDIMIYTNFNGRARFEGLPTKLRNPPLNFTITYKNIEKAWHWTGLSCHENATIVLNNT